MPISPARAAAFGILLHVEREAAYASESLHSSPYAKLSSPDHALATELVMGVLRWRSSLDGRISQASSQKLERLDLEVLIALRLGAYQLFYLDRIPQRAAIHESVELVKHARERSAAAFVNAVLRRLSASGTGPSGAKAQALPLHEAAGDTVPGLEERYCHPLWLVERWAKEYGFETARRICAYDQCIPLTAIRLRDAGVANELLRENVELEPGVLLASARRVRSGTVTTTRAFAEGRIAIQDEVSQLVALMVGHGSQILDCCAAPGGKTRLLAQQNPDATIVAIELHPHRARLLQKLAPAKNVQVMAADARELPVSAQFDRVLADVPCSGTGTLARNPEIKWRLKPADFADLHARQLAILRSAMSHVAPGGRLVYSTCSLEREENSDVVDEALAANRLFRLLDCRTELELLKREGELMWSDLDSLTTGPYLQTLPGIQPCDGFFAAILERT